LIGGRDAGACAIEANAGKVKHVKDFIPADTVHLSTRCPARNCNEGECSADSSESKFLALSKNG
jgi:hypothetical protein